VNRLYYGDNLDVLRRYVKDESVDLIYLDPPFNSNADYNVLYKEQDGSRAAAQIKAFGDTWRWDKSAAATYQEVVEAGGKVSEAMQALRLLLGDNDVLAYLTMMAPRLVELQRVLKSTGSIYLHCDPGASHYLKILMDAVFGPEHFINEIVWRRTGAHNSNRSFGAIHDTLLFYGKSEEYSFHVLRRPYMKKHVESRYQKAADGKMKFSSGGNVLTGAGITAGDSGKPWRGFNPSAKGRHWAVPGFYDSLMPETYLKLSSTEKLEALYQANLVEIDGTSAWPIMVRLLGERDGTPVQDMWSYQPYTEGTVWGTNEGIDSDVAWLGPTDPERLGYPTQKPLGLLERIIAVSSDDHGVVLDPFCGCGTAIMAAEKNGCQWIGIDITHLAITLMKHRLADAFGKAPVYEVIGEPVSLPDAQALADSDKYQFEWWALGLVGARPTDPKKGSDKGIDGRLYFHDEGDGSKTKQVIFSVKGGHTDVSHVRDLRGVLDREHAELGVLITMQQPTQPMRTEAASGGFYHSPGWRRDYPKIQILTIDDLLSGKGIQMPPLGNVTFKKAPPAVRDRGETEDLGI
jgi:site-specific DNA-methyltransferase (adenine-specific)